MLLSGKKFVFDTFFDFLNIFFRCKEKLSKHYEKYFFKTKPRFTH